MRPHQNPSVVGACYQLSRIASACTKRRVSLSCVFHVRVFLALPFGPGFGGSSARSSWANEFEALPLIDSSPVGGAELEASPVESVSRSMSIGPDWPGSGNSLSAGSVTCLLPTLVSTHALDPVWSVVFVPAPASNWCSFLSLISCNIPCTNSSPWSASSEPAVAPASSGSFPVRVLIFSSPIPRPIV